MSWEPDIPVGFSPCGTAFGAVRKCYSAPCKFFADDSVTDNRINWYWVPDDTPIYEGPTVFWPRVDVPPPEANSQFEREGMPYLRIKDDGDTFSLVSGQHVHGNDADFLGLSQRSKYYEGDSPPGAPCATIRTERAYWLLGGELGDDVIHTSDIGLKIAGSTSKTVGQHNAGIRLGAQIRSATPDIFCGLALGGVTLKTLLPLNAGIQLGALVMKADPPAMIRTAGIAIGAMAQSVIGVRSCGLALGGYSIDPTVVTIEQFNAGLALGGVSSGGVGLVEGGLALGGVSSGIVGLVEGGLALGGNARSEVGQIAGGVGVGGEPVSAIGEVEGGLALGGEVSGDVVELVDAGIELGGVTDDPPAPVEIVDAGIAIGGVSSDAAPPLVLYTLTRADVRWGSDLLNETEVDQENYFGGEGLKITVHLTPDGEGNSNCAPYWINPDYPSAGKDLSAYDGIRIHLQSLGTTDGGDWQWSPFVFYDGESGFWQGDVVSSDLVTPLNLDVVFADAGITTPGDIQAIGFVIVHVGSESPTSIYFAWESYF